MNTINNTGGAYQRLNRTQGFSLIEVMVGALILAVGFIGYSYAGGVSIKSAQDNYFRSKAVMLGNDILERMRTNADYAITDGAGYRYESNGEANLPVSCVGRICTPAALKTWDLAVWDFYLTQELLDATGAITFNDIAAGLREYTVTISYSNRVNLSDDKDTPVKHHIVVSSVL